MLARSISDDVVVATVVPDALATQPVPDRRRVPGPAGEGGGGGAGRGPKPRSVPTCAVELVIHHARSVSSGLLEVARQHNATLVALGVVLQRRAGSGVPRRGGPADPAQLRHPGDFGAPGLRHRPGERPGLPGHGGLRTSGPGQRPAVDRRLGGQRHRGIAPGRLLRRPAAERRDRRHPTGRGGPGRAASGPTTSKATSGRPSARTAPMRWRPGWTSSSVRAGPGPRR